MAHETPRARSERPHRYDCVVISDLHLGSEVCQASLLEEFLRWAVEHTDELVINGDVFDDLNFKRLSKKHFACLKTIRRNSDRDDVRLVWVRGNHDGPAEVVGHIVGVEVLDEYIFERDGFRLLILHGDQFDKFVNNYGFLTEIACLIFYYIQRWAPHQTARYVRRVSKRWQRSSETIRDGAVAFAVANGCGHVTCGHTHIYGLETVGDVVYANTGTWTEHPPCPFLCVKDGELRLEFWPDVLKSAEAIDTQESPPAEAASPSDPRPVHAS